MSSSTSTTKAKRVSGILSVLGVAFIVALALTANVGPVQSDPPEISHDGLHLEKGTGNSIVYVDPDADFSEYSKYMMLQPYVAFKKNWARNTKVAGRSIPKKHIEKMKTEAASLLEEVFQEALEGESGFPLVTEADNDVLLLRPAIVDLVVTAPDVPIAGRIEQYTSSSIAATLYLELYDSVTGDILLRAIDRQVVRDSGYARWTNSVTNRADAKRIYKRWATWLAESWNEVRAERVIEQP